MGGAEREPGLRERKMARTRASIQECAYRLFRERGYKETTIEQVAREAEVSVSTLFRYFPTKEDLVIQDDYDPLIMAVFSAQPKGRGLVETMRASIRELKARMTAEDLRSIDERMLLIMKVPELRARLLESFDSGMRMVSGMFARRLELDPSDDRVIASAGVVFGVIMGALFAYLEKPGVDFFDFIDKGLAIVESSI